MSDDSAQPAEKDRSDESLTPSEAWRLTEEQGLQGKTVAKMFGVDPSYVSRQRKEYQQAHKAGRDSVSATDFEAEDLRQAIADKEPEDNPYSVAAECPRCSADILDSEKPNSPGLHDCPHCNQPIEWGADEL